MSKERKNGYYWCRYNETWEIALYKDGWWYIIQHIIKFTDRTWDEVIEEPIMRPGTLQPIKRKDQ